MLLYTHAVISVSISVIAIHVQVNFIGWKRQQLQKTNLLTRLIMSNLIRLLHQCTHPNISRIKFMWLFFLQYRNSLCRVQGLGDIPLLFGKEVATGIPDSILRTISGNCYNFNNPSHFNYLSQDQATDIF